MTWKRIISQKLHKKVFDPNTGRTVIDSRPSGPGKPGPAPTGYKPSKPKGPAGRTCAEETCDTVLSVYNKKNLCAVHDPDKGN